MKRTFHAFVRARRHGLVAVGAVRGFSAAKKAAQAVADRLDRGGHGTDVLVFRETGGLAYSHSDMHGNYL